MHRILSLLLSASFTMAVSANAQTGQVALKDGCFVVSQGNSAYSFAIAGDGVKCVLTDKSTIASVTVAVYSQAQLDAKLAAIQASVERSRLDAIKSIKETVDAQALKKDDVARVVQITKDDIYAQLLNDLKKAVQDAIAKTTKEQIEAMVQKANQELIAAEVAKQLAKQAKP